MLFYPCQKKSEGFGSHAIASNHGCRCSKLYTDNNVLSANLCYGMHKNLYKTCCNRKDWASFIAYYPWLCDVIVTMNEYIDALVLSYWEISKATGEVSHRV